MNDLRVLTCGRRDAARTLLVESLRGLGIQAAEADDPAGALSLAAAASGAAASFDVMLVDAAGLHAGDYESLQRICVLFGAPCISLVAVGRFDDVSPNVGSTPPDVRLDDAGDSTALFAALATAFGVSTARTAAAQTGIARTGAAQTGAGCGDEPVRILLVEDNEVNQLVAAGMLNTLGYGHDVVSNGVEGLEAVAGGGFDLVLMDVRMPVMDGLEATRRIRALPDPLGKIPIVAVTANAMRGDEEACLESGMNDYLAKPIRLTVLDAALKRWLPAR